MKTWGRALVATVAVAAVGLMTGPAPTGLAPASASPVAAARYDPPPISWGPCEAPGLIAAGAQCGFLVVPLDYAEPDGETIRLAVSRVKHKTSDSVAQGVMVVGPDGPGAPGLGLSRLQSRVPNGAGNSYDWIGMDSRGVGASEPRLTCTAEFVDEGDRPPYAPDGEGSEEAWKQRAVQYAQACEDSSAAELLPFMTVAEAARDLDSLRLALDVEKISYYGFGYGTYAGQVYASTFPNRVNRLVLDSPVNPRAVGFKAEKRSSRATERSVGVFFGWVARYDNAYGLGVVRSEVEARYYDTVAALDEQAEEGVLGGSEFTDVIFRATLDPFGWEDIARAWSDYENDGDPGLLITLSGASSQPAAEGADNQVAAYLATTCTNSTWNQPRRIDTAHARVAASAPFATWRNGRYNGPCAYWPVRGGARPQVNGSATPALLVAETLDSVSPFDDVLKVRRLFPQARLVEGVGGTAHSATLQGTPCINTSVARYLADGSLPARQAEERSDLQCAPNPQPVPSTQGQN